MTLSFFTLFLNHESKRSFVKQIRLISFAELYSGCYLLDNMIEISHLRNDLEGLRSSISRKKFDCDLDALVESDLKRREAISAAEQARAGQKAANSEMSQLSKGSPEFLAKVVEMKELAA